MSEWRIVTVSANARLPLKRLVGTVVTLWTTLADGGRMRRSGLVRKAEKLGADGSLARYRLTVVPWLWLTTQQRHSQVFQNRALADIAEQILSPYAPHAVWRYTAGAQRRIDELGAREHISQYRETDYASPLKKGAAFVFYENVSFRRVSCIVNLPGHLNRDNPSLNGLVDRYHAYAYAQALLLDWPTFPDKEGTTQFKPEDYEWKR